MKPRKTDVSVAGRLGEATSSRQRQNYGVDRLGIAREEAADAAQNAQSELEQQATRAVEVAQAAPVALSQAVPTTETTEQSAPASSRQAAPPQAAPANDEAAHQARTSRRLRLRRSHLMAAAGLIAVVVAVVMIVKIKSASHSPAGAGAMSPSLPTALPTPGVKMPTPAGAYTLNLGIKLRSRAADVALAIQVARLKGQQASADVLHWLANAQSAATKTSPNGTSVEPKVAITVDPLPKPSPSPSPTPAVRYRDCPAGFSLSGVIRMPDGAVANINGRMVKIGGEVNSAKLVSIGDYSVEMELNGERFILAIGQDDAAPAPSKPSAADDDSSDKPEPASKPARPRAKKVEE